MQKILGWLCSYAFKNIKAWINKHLSVWAHEILLIIEL